MKFTHLQYLPGKNAHQVWMRKKSIACVIFNIPFQKIKKDSTAPKIDMKRYHCSCKKLALLKFS
jgi:hypothetical protein